MNISSLMGGAGGMPNVSAIRDRMFQKADLNGDKGISLEEFQSAGKKMPIGKGGDGSRAAEAFGKLDKDGNGSLSRDEMSALGDKMSSTMQSMMMKMQEMMGGGGLGLAAMFDKAESDHGMDALLHGMKAYGKSVTGGASSDMMSSLLDMLDGGTSTDEDDSTLAA
ncbi:MAG: EF-hand domain-containing protein [Beijerinckiaceae bacterium]|nr:EF-hand domain-containing protein [Beijerinckiaceae bacterium]